MKFLLLNQTFYPDVVATGQYLSEVAVALAARGHEVTVVTSRLAYDDPTRRFAKTELWRGVRIHRVGSTAFGKGARWRRAADFGSNLLCCLARVARLPRQDAVIALTSPPLISVLGAAAAQVWGARFFYWIMDFNPDEAVAAGWLRAGSPAFRALDWISRYSLRHAAKVIALDRFMRDRVVAKGIPAARVEVLPPWSHDNQVSFDAAGRERFRQAHGLGGKFVVMHSGNHSPVHPLVTLLDAAARLRDDPGVVFLFVGGGSEFQRVKARVAADQLPNVRCLSYQPLDQLSASLSAADLHVVVMGDAFVGLIHPCKIYNIMAVGAPMLYLGPEPSHVTEILAQLGAGYDFGSARHGDVETVLHEIARLRAATAGEVNRQPPPIAESFSQRQLLSRMVNVLETTEPL